MSFSGRLRATTDATGQALVLTVIFLVVLLGFAGFAIDVGHAYLVQRQLQAGVDAAALAGAQEMPTQSQARTTAIAYGPTGSTNPVVGAEIDPSTGITFKCVRTVGCTSRRSPQNAITVSARSVVPTWFAKLLGHDAFTVNARATACSPCTAKKFDIVVVLDRTGSMLDRNNGMTDLENAKEGIYTFLSAMDPELDHVGLGVFPPAVGGPAPAPPNGSLAPNSDPCTAPTNSRSRYGYNAWWPAWDGRGGLNSDSAVYTAASLSNDYISETSPGDWDLNYTSSTLVSRIGCINAGGTTSYANALIEAKRELMRNGRSDAQDVIVFFTDGAANTMPNDSPLETNRLPSMAPGIADPLTPLGQIDLGNYWNRPCSAGLAAANWAKATTQIYVIGYDVNGSNGGSCGEPGVTAATTLRAMATDPFDFYQPLAGDDLGGVFDSIATDLIKPAGQLIDDNLS